MVSRSVVPMAISHPSSPIGRAPDGTLATARRGGAAEQSGAADWLGRGGARAALIGGSRAGAWRGRGWLVGAVAGGCQGPVARRRGDVRVGESRGIRGLLDVTPAGLLAPAGRSAGIGGEERPGGGGAADRSGGAAVLRNREGRAPSQAQAWSRAAAGDGSGRRHQDGLEAA